ncbi:MAG: hypothetical protein ACLQPD_16625 [Desulfomonilaceae bacterium]
MSINQQLVLCLGSGFKQFTNILGFGQIGFQVLAYEDKKSFLELTIFVFSDIVSSRDKLKDLRTFLFPEFNNPLPGAQPDSSRI